MEFRPQFGRALVVVLLLAAFAIGAFAQGSGDLTGVVTDPSGAVVPKVAVSLTNDATAIARNTETTAAGVYRFTGLPAGIYTLTINAKGFRPVSVKGLEITTGTTATHDMALQVGGTTETVTVEAGAQMVQTTESSVSQLVDNHIFQQMPLEVRNPNSFIELIPGASPNATNGSGNRGAAVNGARAGAGNYLVDGMDNNEQGQGGRGQLGDDPGGSSTSISPDAVQEYRVITNSFSAEYGKAGGFVTDTVMKSGSNQFHGSAFEYNRVQALAANDYFSNRAGLKDSLVRNQFGGSFGGPIIKDRAFFFGSLEFHRMRQGGNLTATGTTQQFIDYVNSGQFATAMENAYGLPAGSLGAQSRTLGPIFNSLVASQPFPLATSGYSYDGAGYWTSGVTFPVPVYGDVFVIDPYHLNEYRISGKGDVKLTNNDQLSVVYLHQHAESGSPFDGGATTIGPSYTNNGVGINLGISWTHTLNPTTLNVARVEYLRHRSDFPQAPGTAGIPAIATFFDPLSVGFGMYAGLPQFFTENQFQYQDQMSMVRGKHSFKFGGEYRRTRNGSSFYNDTYGSFYPNGVEDLLTDLYFTDQMENALVANGVITDGDRVGASYLASAALDQTTNNVPDPYRGFRANELAMFVQDDWRVSNRLTLNLGLRWEYFGPPHNFKPNIDSNFYFGGLTTLTPQNPYMPTNVFAQGIATGNFQIRNHEIWNKDTNNFSPRIGFAYDVLGNQKLVLRAGAGIMYDRIYNNTFENIRFNPPHFADYSLGTYAGAGLVGALYTPGLYAVPFSNNAGFTAGVTPLPNPRHMDQNIVTPYYEQMHFGFQWEFAHGFVFEPEYIGTFGHKLVSYRDINTYDGRTACPRLSGGATYAAGTACAEAGFTTGSTSRISTTIGADNYRSNGYNSNYHALQLTVRKTLSHGLGFNANYTWSKALDYISDTFNGREGSTVTDTWNPQYDYGPADFNLKHRAVASVSYDLPFFKQNRWIGGWSLNSIISLQSGIPFSPYSSSSSNDKNKNGVFNDRIVPVTTAAATYTGGNAADGYFDPAGWMAPAGSGSYYHCPADVNNGLWCLVPIGRNSMVGPKFANVDLGLHKDFKINERFKLQLQGNFFNLFNRANFYIPSTNATSPSFGRSTSTVGNARITQLALRLDF